ncbi:alkylated DNA repair dioxygenase AlkB [Mesorhizobium abyssinicae]
MPGAPPLRWLAQREQLPQLWYMSLRSKGPTGANGGQPDLFAAADDLPEGFRYKPELITPEEEWELLRHLEGLPFQPFDFHGHLANRQVIGFGLRYDYDRRQVVEAPPIPDFLMTLRRKVATFVGLPESAFEQVLINEYRPGAGIGWHRDKPHFETVAGVSLLAPCSFRLRRKNGTKWDRKTIIVEPRSAYLLRGPARDEWEHSIPPLTEHRYSITLRTLRKK